MLKILCGINDQEHSELAAEVAIDLARRLQARLWFFMVNPVILPGRGPVEHLYSKNCVAGYLQEALRRANAAGVFDVRSETRHVSNIADAIIDYANELGADYVVIGSDRRPRPMDWLRDSISQRIITLAEFPVLVVKRKRY